MAHRIEATDPRWVFAARVAENLDGYSAAILAPERRDRLMKLARVLGLREFDANLIIAIVQDSARCGVGPLSNSTAERLLMVHGATSASQPSIMTSRPMIVAWGAALGVFVAMMLIQWVH